MIRFAAEEILKLRIPRFRLMFTAPGSVVPSGADWSGQEESLAVAGLASWKKPGGGA